MSDKNGFPQVLHFIGIGGIGMSGIARICLAQGLRVQGSDLKSNDVFPALEAAGARLFIGHDASHVDGADLVVYSSSIPEDHPERLAAVKKGIPVLHRSEALADLCRGKFTIAVTGTHGKTTTSSLIGMMLVEAGRDPSIVVGGIVEALGGNARSGKGAEIVIEADESDSSFLRFSPDLAVVTNIEEEHLDHFKDLAHIEGVFRDFISRLRKGGSWFGCAEDARVAALAKNSPSAVSYGFSKEAALAATDIVECPGGTRGVSFRVRQAGKELGTVTLRIPGRHNALNALAAVGVGLKLGIPFFVIAAALAKFEGARRRFDVKYEDGETLVVDDYAHHPTEIQKTLEAAKALKKKRILAVFQPHRYSRTELLMREFTGCFGGADKLIVTDIYAASEKPRPGITGERLCEEVRRAGHPDAVYAARTMVESIARDQMRPGDLVLVMGAGDIHQVAAHLADSLRAPGGAIRGRWLKNEPLAKHTSLKIGGPAEYWAEPEDEEDLKQVLRRAKEERLAVSIFGAGSNLLPPDEGIRGVVIHLGAPYFRRMRMEGGRLVAGAGVPNTLFIPFAMEQGLGGCEFLLGIPGNIGGAIAMNAGSHGQWIQPFVKSVTTVTMSGERRVRQASEIPFAYRHCGIRDEVIVEAVFEFPRAERGQVQKKLDEYREYRAATQDLQHPSAGCMFKNPEIPGCSAGRLIDEAGLKGLRVGNAQVSEKHANFIINLGGATAEDVKRLIGQVRETVKQKTGTELETEVKIL